jgi:hypothetical protein
MTRIADAAIRIMNIEGGLYRGCLQRNGSAR